MSNPESYTYDHDDYDEPFQREDRRQKRITVLENRLDEMHQERKAEEKLRAHHPTLQDAWDKYQTLLILARQR